MTAPHFSYRQALNDRVWSLIAVSCTLLFVVLYIIGCIGHFKDANAKKKWNYVLHFFSMFSLILFCAHSLIICLNNWSVFGDPQCAIIQKVTFSVYHCAKGFLYFVLITRLRVVFADSIFAYSAVLINTLSILVMASMSGLIVADFVFISGALDITPWSRCVRVQEDGIDTVLCKLFLVTDGCINTLCLAMFIHKMRQCLINNDGHHQIPQNEKQKAFHRKLSYIMVKYSVLSLMSILSTSIFIILFTFIDISSSYSLSFDGMINAFCLLVMAKFWDHIYRGCPICFYLHSSFSYCCFQHKGDIDMDLETRSTRITTVTTSTSKKHKLQPVDDL